MESCKSRVFEILFAAFPERVKISDSRDVIFSKDLFAIAFMRIRRDLSNVFYVEVNHSTGKCLFLKYTPPAPEDDGLLTKNLLRSVESFCHDITSGFIGFYKEMGGDLKFITKEKAGTAAKWWSHQLRTGHALPFFKPELSSRISRFETILAERLSLVFQKPHGVKIAVDYSPRRILKQCWEKSDPEDQTDEIGVFPFKTSMIIYEDRIMANGERI